MAADLSDQRWARINEILRRAVELAAPERRAFIHAACGEHSSLCREALALLDAYEADESAWRFSTSPLFGYALRALADQSAMSFIGGKIGAYRIVRELGVGGMGTVYLAVRDDEAFEKEVAVKIVHQYAAEGEFLQKRLRMERAILARLEHPNIARLLDGGTTATGLPFFVMEYVPGAPITTYSEQRHLTIRRRLEMFQSVCDAVHYAHRNLVVHRDLKPGNILVLDDGTPKLIDFGIAKLLDEQTRAAERRTTTVQRAMTLPYASPEQVQGEPVTTASDVYSLGVVLYELLTGVLPFRTAEGAPSLEHQIQHVEPPPPSVAARNRELAGDLDAIVLRAMHKDPQARYASAEQLAADIERYLQGWPVLARGASARYRLRKFLRRHRVTVALALAATAALIGATMFSLRQAQAAQAARQRAERRFQETWQLARSNVFELHDAVAQLAGSTGVRGLLVRQTLGYLDRLSQEAGSDPTFHRELGRAYIRVGEVQGRPYTANLGDVPGAQKSYETGLRWLEKAYQARPNEAACQRDLSIGHERMAELLMYRLRDFAAARPHLERVEALREALTKAQPDDPETRYLNATLAIVRGDWSHMQGDPAEALKRFAAAHRLLEPLAASPTATPACQRRFAGALQRKIYCLLSLGTEAERHGLPEEAQQMHRRALALHQTALEVRKRLAAANPASVELRRSVLDSLVDEAELNGRLRRYAAARALFEATLEQFQSLAAEDQTNRELLYDMASLLRRFAAVEEAAGRPEAALACWRRVEGLVQNIMEAGCTDTEARLLPPEVNANIMRLGAQCGQKSLAHAAARKLEAVLPALPGGAERVHYWLVIFKARRRLGDHDAARQAQARLTQWLTENDTEQASPEICLLAATLYLDEEAPEFANPRRALDLARRVAAAWSDEATVPNWLLMKALERTGGAAEAERRRQTYAQRLRRLYQENA